MRIRSAAIKSLLEWIARRSLAVYVAAAVILGIGATGVAAATGTFSADTSPSPTATATASASPDDPSLPQGGGGKNIVQVVNKHDGAFKMDGKVKLNQIHGPNAAPVNQAIAISSCTDCQTLAVALQINLIGTQATNIQPQNAAVAINYQCTRCVTVAKAFQYNISVVDPDAVPDDVKKLIHRMEAEIKDIRATNVGFSDAYRRVNQVIAEFKSLANDLKVAQDEARDSTTPGASPPPIDSSPEPSGSPAVSSSPAASPSASP